MADDLIVLPRRGIVARALAWLARAGAEPVPATEPPVHGDASAYPRPPGYAPLASMSAYGAFAWVYAAVNAITADVGSRPIRLYRRVPNGEDEELVDHEVLDLLRQPSTRIDGEHFHRQRILDRVLEGNAYTVIVEGYDGRPLSLLRLHPARVEIKPTSDNQPDLYVFDSRTLYDYRSVLHVRGASWEDDGRGLYGQGLIRALHRELAADLASWERQAQQHARGRPDYVVTPDDSDLGAWSREQVAQVREAVDRMLAANHGGIGIAPASAKFERLSWSDADLGVTEMRVEIRDRVLGAAGVPPTRVSLPTANYAQSAEQMRGYWQHTIQPLARELDRVDTKVARLYDPSLYIRRDFSDVPVLQADATARLQRVQMHYTMGVPLASAYRAEGLTPPDGVSDDAPEGESSDRVATWIAGTRAASTRARWTRYIREAQEPAERRLTRTLARLLREQARRVASGLAETEARAWTRAEADDRLREVFDVALETRLMTEGLTPDVIRAIELGFVDAAADLPLTLTFDPDRTGAAATIAQLVAGVTQTTIDALRVQIEASIEAAESITDLQRRILGAAAFSPMRARRIARTESTRYTNQGARDAMRAGQAEGVRVRKMWTAQIDGATRETHAAMDGVTVGVDEEFVLPDGETTQQPCGAGLSAHNAVNCRCGIVPLVGDT